MGTGSFFMSKRVLLTVAIVALVATSAFGYRSWSMRITPEKVAAGKFLFEHEWTENDPLSTGDGLGPVFNDVSCVACHFQGGTGGAGPNAKNVTTFTVIPTSNRPEPVSGVLHASAIADVFQESRKNLRNRFPIIKGEVREVEMEGCGTTRYVVPDFDPVLTQSINTPALFGLAEIETIPSYVIAFHSANRTFENIKNDYTGEVSGNSAGVSVTDGTVAGKFGWKGQHGSLEDFIAKACAVEIGLSNSMRKQDLPGKFTEDKKAELDMTSRQFHELVCFVRSLPRPVQVWPTDPTLNAQAREGENVFQRIGCAQCHVPDLGGVEGIYSDFNLYNLTPPNQQSGLYGNADLPSNFTELDLWKTPPLWGVADSAPYMHDGSAPTLDAAIRHHKRDAAGSGKLYEGLNSNDRKCLIAFLKTLRSPFAENDTDAQITQAQKLSLHPQRVSMGQE